MTLNSLFALNLSLFLICLLCTIGVGVLLLYRRQVPGGFAYGIVLWCEGAWLIGLVMEILVPDLPTKLLVDKLQSIPFMALPPLLIWFVSDFTGARKRPPRWPAFLTLLISVGLLTMLLTDGMRGWERSGAALVLEGGVARLRYPLGLWDFASMAYMALVLAGIIPILAMYGRRQPKLFRPQIASILMGFALPLLSYLASLLNIRIGTQFGAFPYALALGNALIAWGLFRHRLFDLHPIAADTVLERNSDAVLIVDHLGRVIDLNPAAKKLSWLPQAVVGSPAGLIFQSCSGFPARLDTPIQSELECVFQQDAPDQFYDGTLTPLFDYSGVFAGHMIVLREVTGSKRTEEELRRMQAELEERVVQRTEELTQTVALLRQSEEKFRALVEQSAEGFVLINPEGRIAEWNHARARLTRVTREEALGSFIWDVQERTVPEELRTPERNERLRDLTLQALRGESAVLFEHDYELDYRDSRDDKGVMLQSVFPVQVGGERWLGLVSRDITERKLDEERLRNSVEKLNSLRSIDQAILSRMELDLTLKFIAHQAQRELKADAVVILLNNQVTGEITHRFILGDHQCDMNAGVGCVAVDVIRKRKSIRAAPCPFPCNQEEKFGFCAAIPIKLDGKVRGVLEVFYQAEGDASDQDFGFLEALAGQTAISIDQRDLFQSLERSNQELKSAYEAAIIGWARALEIRDKETRGHSERVTMLALELARRLNYPTAQIDDFRHGVILHDIGKMLVPDSILNKPAALNADEWVIMREHVNYGFEILSTNPYLSKSLDIPHYHHEWWNGKGYPRQLRGEEIPLGARIFAVVDVWDALIERRVYRDPWPPEVVIAYIRSQSGEMFDPAVVDAFIEMVQTRITRTAD